MVGEHSRKEVEEGVVVVVVVEEHSRKGEEGVVVGEEDPWQKLEVEVGEREEEEGKVEVGEHSRKVEEGVGEKDRWQK